MRTTILIAVTFLWLMSLGAAAQTQPLNIRTGLWETTMTTTTSGTMPIPAELLSRLTPEQRIAMEERMKASSGEKTRTMTNQGCLTKEQLEKGVEFGQKDKECAQTVVTSTASKVDVRIACADENMKSSGNMHFEALNPESVKGSGQMSVTGGGNTMNVKTSFTSKWLGPACGSVK